MEERFIKVNALLLLAIIPLSVVGYLFAVENESLFFLYEWALAFIVILVLILSIISIVKVRGNLKWVSFSILAFTVQFAVMGLFLGPFTEYVFFYIFYIAVVIAFVTFILAFRKVKKYRFLPITFSVICVIFTFYMFLLNNLWGKDLT